MDVTNPIELMEGMYFRKMGTKNGDTKRTVGNGKSARAMFSDALPCFLLLFKLFLHYAPQRFAVSEG